jgi:predicted nucleotidyltransferase
VEKKKSDHSYVPRSTPSLLSEEQEKLSKASGEAYLKYMMETDPDLRRLLFSAYERASNAFMDSIKKTRKS